MAYKMKTNIANRANYGKKRSTSKIKYIVIHFTGNPFDTDENNGKYFARKIVEASAHYFVDSDSVTQSVPDNYVAYSVGGSKYNNCKETGGGKFFAKATNTNTLNIELCDDVKNGKVYPSKATIDNAVALTKSLMKKYNIPASRVIRHFDVTGKSCPAYWVDDAKWEKEFHSKLSTTSKKETVAKKKSITVIAKEVVAGKWGNGETRKKKLKAAGYDYSAVQKKVNELLK